VQESTILRDSKSHLRIDVKDLLKQDKTAPLLIAIRKRTCIPASKFDADRSTRPTALAMKLMHLQTSVLAATRRTLIARGVSPW
jgi:hypothetical protein